MAIFVTFYHLFSPIHLYFHTLSFFIRSLDVWNVHLPTTNHGVTCNNAEIFTITVYSFLICISSAIYSLSLHISHNLSCCVSSFSYHFSSYYTSSLFHLSSSLLSLPPQTCESLQLQKGMKGNRLPRQPLTLTGVWSFNARLRSDNSIKGGRNLVRMWSLSAQESGIQIADNCSRLTALRFRLSELPPPPLPPLGPTSLPSWRGLNTASPYSLHHDSYSVDCMYLVGVICDLGSELVTKLQ